MVSKAVGLTPELRNVLELLLHKENLNFSTMDSVRDYAVAHAIRNKLEKRSFEGKVSTVWGSANLDDDLYILLQTIYPDYEDHVLLYQNLSMAGLEHLSQIEDFEFWAELDDLPGFENEEENV